MNSLITIFGNTVCSRSKYLQRRFAYASENDREMSLCEFAEMMLNVKLTLLCFFLGEMAVIAAGGSVG